MERKRTMRKSKHKDSTHVAAELFAAVGRELHPTRHAATRQAQRAIGAPAVAATLLYGREVPAGKGDAALYIGRREVEYARRRGIDLRGFKGVTVIELWDGRIKTVYRNRRAPKRRCALHRSRR